MKPEDSKIPPELAPCGIFCGACPSFGKGCRGCPTEDTRQKRKSKWSCRIRNCCYFIENVEFCFNCGEFPCKELVRKLCKSHPGDPRFKYRHEILENLEKLSELGNEEYLRYQVKKWQCSACKGRIHWYKYRCSECNEDVLKTG
jgi:hypothetical protein